SSIQAMEARLCACVSSWSTTAKAFEPSSKGMRREAPVPKWTDVRQGLGSSLIPTLLRYAQEPGRRANRLRAAERVHRPPRDRRAPRALDDFGREVIAHDHSVLPPHDEPLDDVLELADVAGPVVVDDRVERLGRNGGRRRPAPLRMPPHEMLEQNGNVLFPC